MLRFVLAIASAIAASTVALPAQSYSIALASARSAVAGEGCIVNLPDRTMLAGSIVPLSPSHVVRLESSGAIALITFYQGGEVLEDYAESWQDVAEFVAQAAIWQGPIVAPGGNEDRFMTVYTDKLGLVHTITTAATGPSAWKDHVRKVRDSIREFPPMPVPVPGPGGGGAMAWLLLTGERGPDIGSMSGFTLRRVA